MWCTQILDTINPLKYLHLVVLILATTNELWCCYYRKIGYFWLSMYWYLHFTAFLIDHTYL